MKPPTEEEVYHRVNDALDAFARETDLPCASPDERSRVFEQFANALVLTRHEVDAFERQAVLSRGGHDTQLDGVAIIANGLLVTSEEDVAPALARAERAGQLRVDFVLIQATLTRRLSTQKLTKFGYGVLNFMQRDDKLNENKTLRRLRRAKNALEAALKTFRGDTHVEWTLYYVWAGHLRNAPPHGYFSLLPDAFDGSAARENVRVEPIYGLRALALWERVRAPREAAFDFPDALELPSIPGAERGYLGFVRARELLRLVTSPEGEILEGAFEENVRHYLGDDPPVNRAIAQTLEAGRGHEFVLRNNGVTIVARSAERGEDGRTALVDHHVVNGCQTTFVLFRLRDRLDDRVLVPLKLVVTGDADMKDAIVRGANSQSIVRDSEMLARRPFVRRLQMAFDDSRYGRAGELEFERRLGEKSAAERETP
ncbi:MAG: AIPR family protein, partial [Caulobacterales bacterium]|nr:AIPR family protein [Caulobacterales bacterium]